LNGDKDLSELRKQVIDSLNLSKERVRNSIQSEESRLKNDLIWGAYSQVELAIGLAKLSYEDQIEDKAGSFRDLKSRTQGKSEVPSEKINSKLALCEVLLMQAISKFQEERGGAEGLKMAREARDILKLLVLEENLARTRKARGRSSVSKRS
jgi:hypothetical protein